MVLAPVSKNENVLFPRGDQAIQLTLSLQVSHQKLIFSRPYGRIPRGHPPNFMDFLPTNSSRKNPDPPQVLGWRVEVGGWSWELGAWRLELGAGGERLEVGGWRLVVGC